MLLTREHVDYYSRPNKLKHRAHRMKTFSVFVSVATQSNTTSASLSQLLKLGGDIMWKCGVWHVISEMSGVSAAPFCTLCWPDGGQTFGTLARCSDPLLHLPAVWISAFLRLQKVTVWKLCWFNECRCFPVRKLSQIFSVCTTKLLVREQTVKHLLTYWFGPVSTPCAPLMLSV